MLFILDKSHEVVGSLNSNGDLSRITTYFDDKYVQDLGTGAETFEFSTVADTEQAQHLVAGNFVAFKEDGEFKLFHIIQIEETHDDTFIKTCYCEMAGIELINEIIRPMKILNSSLRKFLTTILEGTEWQLGKLDAGFTQVFDFETTDYKSAYELIQEYAVRTYGAEISYRVEIAHGRIVGKYIDCYKQRGNENGFRFAYGSNLTSVTKTVDMSNLATALIGVGNNGITFKEVDTPDKPLNSDFIVNETAYKQWNINGSHIFGVHKEDTDSPQELLRLTRLALEERANPQIKYEMKVELLGKEVKIGDTVNIIDHEFNPPLYLSARVNQLTKSKTDPLNDEVVLANFKEVRSNITDEMRQLASQLEGYVDNQFPISGDKIQDGAIGKEQFSKQYHTEIVADAVYASLVETEELIAGKADIGDLTAINATIENLKVEKADITDLNATNATIENLKVNKADIDDLNTVNANIENLKANKADIGDLNAINATIGNLQANKADITELNAVKGSITILESEVAEIGQIKSDVADIEHILAGNITADNIASGTITSDKIQTGAITAGSGIIADGAIGSAQISSLDAGKISAGTVDTSKVTIQGTNGHLRIKGNRLQVFNGTGSNAIERVSLGDVNGNGSIYGLRVRGADGRTVLLDENGVTSEGITDGAITNDKISDDANIDGAKLNINSVVNKINEDGTETIQGTKIEVDGTTLNTKLSTITTKQTEDSERISQAQSQITANTNAIKLKVDEQTYTTDKKDMTSKLEKNTSEISTMKGQIALKVEQTDVTNAINNLKIGGKNLLLNSAMISSSNWSSFSGTIVNGYKPNVNAMRIDNSSATSGYVDKLQQEVHNGTTKLLEPSSWYTFSFYVKGSGKLKTHIYPSLIDTSIKGYADEQECTLGSDGNKDWNLTDVWTRHTYTFKTRAEIPATSQNVLFRVYYGNNVYICMPQLEKGNKASDWNIASEDIDSNTDKKINSAKAEIKVTTDAISQNVSNLSQTVSTKADGSTVTTLSSKVGSLETSVNGISGKVTNLEKTTTTLGTQVSDAQNTANSAINKANNAQSTANTANSTANANKSNITNLQGEVSTVKSDIASLEVTTSGISQKVSSVESTTASLSTQVTTAQNTANSAQSTANSANSNATNALNKANDANILASSKAKVFTSTPTVPYQVGDLWVQGTNGDVMRCKVTRSSGSYNASDWEKGSKYTDDTKANSVDSKVTNLQTDYNSTKSKVATLETNLDGITQRVSSTESTTTTLTAQVSTAQNTANKAVTDASNAQSTANTANTNATSAINKANTAQSTADSKAKVFTSTPTVPYKIGDLWVQGTSGDVMKCKTARATGSYTASDWEKASKYTDDTKANAVDSKVTTLQGTVNSTNSKVATLETNLNGITQRVSSTESTTATLTTRVNTVEGTANTAKSTADSAKTTATNAQNTANSANSNATNALNKANDASSKVDNLSIGGTNLLLKTKTFDNLRGGLSKVTETYKNLTVRGGSIPNSQTVVCEYNFTDFNLGDTFTFSFYAKGNLTNLRTYFYGANGYVQVISGINSQGYKVAGADGNTNLKITSEWQRYWVTWTLKTSGDTSVPKYILLRTDGSTVGQEVYVCGCKFEKGNKATEWNPSPEDVQSQIDTHTTQITTTNNKVSEIKTDLNGITSRVGTVESKQTTTDGKVTGLESRMSNAESKITEDAITNTVKKNFYTKSETDNQITSKGYQTQSQVQQTVNGLQVKVSQSGGYNLIKNSTGASQNTRGWTCTSGATLGVGYNDGIGSNNRYFMYLDNGTATSERFAFSSRFKLKPNTKYTFVGYFHNYTTCPSFDVFVLSSTSLADTDTSTTYTNVHHLINSQNTNGSWKKFTATFTTPESTRSGYIRIDNNGYNSSGTNSNRVHWNALLLVEGELELPWSPHPSEVYDGVTTIDKDGITVSNTSSSTYTQIDNESFRVEDNNGGTVAEFSKDSIIPNLSAGIITANEIYSGNICSKSPKAGDIKFIYVNGSTGNDNNAGTQASPYKTVQRAIDDIKDKQDQSVTIYVYNSVPGFDLKGVTGTGVITFSLQDSAVINGYVILGGVTNCIRITNETGSLKATFKNGISIYRCVNVDIYGVTFRGVNSSGNNILIQDTNYCAVNSCDLGGLSTRLDCAIQVKASFLWLHGCRGSNILDVVGQYAFSHVMMARGGTSNVPDYSNGLLVNYDGAGRIQNWTGGTFKKTPSSGWNPTYTPTQKTQTWSFNKIWSDETLNGWSDRQELIQGYASTWNTGRWTGYMQFTDGMSTIRSAISGGTNFSGRLYVQRRTSSGNSTGSKLCLYASDGTLITNSTTINRGQGVWVTLSSAIISKIASGAITYFYLKADANNTSTFFKCEANPKIEITYTK